MKYVAQYTEDTSKRIEDLKVGDIFKSKWRERNKFYHFDTVKSITEDNIIGEIGAYGKNDPSFIAKMSLFNEYKQYVGDVSKGCKWCKNGTEFKENEVRPIYAIPVRKTYRNGNKEHEILLNYNPTINNIKNIAEEWAERDPSGQNYGYEVFWDEKPTYIKYYTLLGPCGHFH